MKLPAATVIRCLAAVMVDLRDRMQEKASHNPRPVKAELRESRRLKAEVLSTQIGRLYALVNRTKGRYADATALGLLCAIAQGHGDAIRGLEDHLHAIKHPAVSVIEELPGWDLCAMVEAILEVSPGNS